MELLELLDKNKDINQLLCWIIYETFYFHNSDN